MAFLQCEDAHGHQESGGSCRDEGSCSVESAQFHAPRTQESVVPVLLAILPPDIFEAADRSLSEEVSLGVLVAAPPDLSVTWQFSLRTALPARAPSSIV